MPNTMLSAAIVSAVLNRMSEQKAHLPSLTADDLVKVQAAAQELADEAWTELEKRGER